MSENGEIYTAGKTIYTAAGNDGVDKFHLWLVAGTIEERKLTMDGRMHNALGFCWLLVVGILFFQSKTIKHNFRI